MSALTDLYNATPAQIAAWVTRTHGISSDGSLQFMNPSRVRREVMARRLRLYRDKARQDVEHTIDQIYQSEKYRETLKRYVPVALEQNVTRRIVDEVASLYDRPALRTPANDVERFRAEERRLRLHEVMQESHRLVTLLNAVLIWQFRGVGGETRLRIITPDSFDAVPHPDDNLVPAAFLLDAAPRIVMQEGDAKAWLPHYELWDDTYRYLISKQGCLVDEIGHPTDKPIEHGLGRIPGALLHRREPTTCLLDDSYGADIESCHLGVALLRVMAMRLSKSQGERQPVLQGNLAHLTMGQSMDGENPLQLPPEVTASMLETKTSPEHYLAMIKDKISALGNTYGMSYEQFSMGEGADLASGKVYQLRREKLTEIRQESRRRWASVNEPEVVALMGFDPTGLTLDYQEQALPQDPAEEIALLRERMKLGADSPVTYLQRKDSDLSREAAIQRMQSNLRDYAGLIQWVRALNVPSEGDAAEPGKTPQENGAMGGRPAESEGEEKSEAA